MRSPPPPPSDCLVATVDLCLDQFEAATAAAVHFCGVNRWQNTNNCGGGGVDDDYGNGCYCCWSGLLRLAAIVVRVWLFFVLLMAAFFFVLRCCFCFCCLALCNQCASFIDAIGRSGSNKANAFGWQWAMDNDGCRCQQEGMLVIVMMAVVVVGKCLMEMLQRYGHKLTAKNCGTRLWR